MKAILMSIQPKWCELIASGKKTVEVRKTAPKEVPFKVYMYESLGKKISCRKCAIWQNCPMRSPFGCNEGAGAVVGEFICDKVECIEENTIYNAKVLCKESCLSIQEIANYTQGKRFFAWHISDLKIYDEPKELGEFYVPCKKYNDGELHCMEWDCEHYSFFPGANGDAEEECLCKGSKPLRRPPQSWCYVEELQ